MKLFILSFLFFAACTKAHESEPKDNPLVKSLQAKYAQWQSDLKSQADANTGWPSLTDCDGTLWTGEAVAAGQVADLELAAYAPGEIHRRPKASGECYPEGAKSTVSNDMLIGYMLGSYKTENLAALENLETYVKMHGGVMGQPPDAHEVLFTPTGMGLLARAVEKLGGPKDSADIVPDPCLPVASDYEFHLQELGIYFGAEVDGPISTECFDALKRNAKDYPKDGLFAGVLGIFSGDQSPALNLLTAEDYACPAYVRGAPTYCLVHKLFAAKVVLGDFKL